MKHATEEHRAIAAGGTILRCLAGSGVHGLSISDQDDRDEMGVCTEPPEYVIGLRRFEQYEWHTAWARPGGRANRSGPGDLDEVVYGLRKYMRLALDGNPTILLPLFAPDRYLIAVTELGRELREMAPLIVSRQAGDRFLGYLDAQRRSLLSRDGKGRDVTRPELIEAYGFDVKFAGHMIRLGVQGAELMRTGRITLPVPEPWRTMIRDVRTGAYSMEWALSTAWELEHQIRDAQGASPLPEYPDRDAADKWLVSAYQRAWAGVA